VTAVNSIFWIITFVYVPDNLMKVPKTVVPPGDKVELTTEIVSIVKSPLTFAARSIIVESFITAESYT
jgi:hypothetical protein